jgi:hypothetical protein
LHDQEFQHLESINERSLDGGTYEPDAPAEQAEYWQHALLQLWRDGYRVAVRRDGAAIDRMGGSLLRSSN